MRKVIIVLLFCLVSSPGWAKFSKEQTVTLLSGLENSDSVGSLERLLEPSSPYAGKAQLIGKMRIILVKRGPSLVQIGWTGACLLDKPEQCVAFDKPMSSFFRAPTTVNSKLELAIEGDPLILEKALEHLEKGKVDVEHLKKKQWLRNPSLEGRRVALPHSKTQSWACVQSEHKKAQKLKAPVDPKMSKLKFSKNPGSNLGYSSDPTSDRVPSLSGDPIGMNTDSGFLEHNSIRGRGRVENDLAEGNRGNTNFGAGVPYTPALPITPGLLGNPLSPQNGPTNELPPPLNRERGLPTVLEPRVLNLENHMPFGPAGERAQPFHPERGLPTALGPQPVNLENPVYPAFVSNRREGVEPFPPAAENAPMQMDPRAEAGQARVGEEEVPLELRYEVIEEGCPPRVDRVHERVIIQNRTRTFEGETLREEGACSDSLEVYPIMKDFLCEGCTDILEPERGRAYSRYQEFWFDREDHKHFLGEALYPDRGRPYHFVDEAGNCEPLVDLETGLVRPQVETVYYNFNNTRKIAQDCHPAPNQRAINIRETTEGCHLHHDFARNLSYEQRKSIYTLDGLSREVLPCRSVGNPIPHEFVVSDCQPVTNLFNHTLTRMVKRKIRTLLGAKIISDECEPQNTGSLEVDRNECQGQYYHDLTAGRSYLKSAYFYMNHNARNYVTPCIRTSEFLPHQLEIRGYTHDDAHRLSRPHIEYFIQTADLGRIVADVAKVRGDLGATPYVLLRNEHRPTADHYFEGCYRRTRTNSINIYQRADGSLYEESIGAGNIIASTIDECTRTTESRSVVVGQTGG